MAEGKANSLACVIISWLIERAGLGVYKGKGREKGIQSSLEESYKRILVICLPILGFVVTLTEVTE